jgi:hypothetical protein
MIDSNFAFLLSYGKPSSNHYRAQGVPDTSQAQGMQVWVVASYLLDSHGAPFTEQEGAHLLNEVSEGPFPGPRDDI